MTWARNTSVVVLVSLLAASSAFAQGQPSATSAMEPWYKILTGIIAIPAALLGLVLSFNILRKTTLESRKLELEIAREQVLPTTTAALTQGLSRPIGQSQRALLLVVRFVVLELTLRLWNVIPSAVGYVTNTIPIAIFYFSERGSMKDLDPSSLPMLAAMAAPQVISFLFSLVYWAIVFGFGWPLLKDTCSFLEIPVGSLLDLPFLGRWKRHGT